MDKSTGDITTRKRPPAAGEPILVRLQPGMLAGLETFMKKWSVASRPEAIRSLIEEGLVKRGLL